MNHFPLFAIALVSAGVVLGEISLTRLFSVTVWYHYSFVAVSLAMLGLSAGAVFVHRRVGRHGVEELDGSLPWLAALAGFVSLAGLAAYLNLDVSGTFMGDSSSPFRLLPTLIFLPGFFLAGAVICGLITRYASAIDRLYFADLAAAGLAGAGTVGLLELLAGPQVFAASGVAMALAAIPLSPRPRRLLFLGGAGGVLTLAVLASLTGLLDVRYTKEYDEGRIEVIHEKWSALSRISVIRQRWFKTDRPYGWGLSPNYKGAPVQEMWLEQDASAGSPITASDGDLSKLEHLDWDVTAAAWSLRDYDRVAVIGLGGGRDALLALRHGAGEVHGIEINRDISDLITDRFADYVGRVFERPEFHLQIEDGRTFLEQTDRIFDLIQISLIDSWAASASGAYILAENSLYTREAFATWLERLAPEGVLTVSRWALTNTPGEVLRLLALSLAALKDHGVEDPAAHVAVLRGELIGTVLVGNRPFTEADIRSLLSYCKKTGFEPLYLPGTTGGLLSVRLLAENARDLDAFLDRLPYDLAPPTDDRPFFFLMLRPMDALSFGAFTWDTGLRQNFTAVRTLYVLFFALLIIVVLLVLLPARSLRRRAKLNSPAAPTAGLFLALGLGFMLVEIPLIQKLVLILGHPIYAVSVVLTCLLVASGVGAALSPRLLPKGQAGARRLVLLLLGLGVLLVGFFSLTNALPHAFLRLGAAARFALVICFTSLAGLVMGLPFPTAIRLLERRGDGAAIPWLWAVNGAAGVLGSVVAFAMALMAGFTAAIGAGVLCYLAAGLLLMRLEKADS